LLSAEFKRSSDKADIRDPLDVSQVKGHPDQNQPASQGSVLLDRTLSGLPDRWLTLLPVATGSLLLVDSPIKRLWYPGNRLFAGMFSMFKKLWPIGKI
jgi:hypothetical protein